MSYESKPQALTASFSADGFDDVNLADTRLNNVNLSDAAITDANLSRLIISDVTLQDADIKDADMTGRWINSVLVTDLIAA